MKTFKQFIAEEDRNIRIEEAVEIFNTRCSDWDLTTPLYRISGASIARGGQPPSPPRDRETRLRAKRSAADSGEVQDWILSKPGFEQFPNRAKSTFCATGLDFAHNSVANKNLYFIYPYNGVKLAATTSNADFNEIELGGFEIMDLADVISTVYVDKVGSSPSTSIKKRWQEIYEKLNGQPMDGGLKRLLSIEAEMTPEKLGLKLYTTSDFPFKLFNSQHEVWFEGKYLSIPAAEHPKFLNIINSL